MTGSTAAAYEKCYRCRHVVEPGREEAAGVSDRFLQNCGGAARRISDAENVACIVAEAGNCAAHETTSGLCGNSEAFADFTEAFALSVK